MGLQASTEHKQNERSRGGRAEGHRSVTDPRPQAGHKYRITPAQHGKIPARLDRQNAGQAAPEQVRKQRNAGRAETARSKDPELWLLSCSPRRQKQPLTRKRSLLLELTSTTPPSDN